MKSWSVIRDIISFVMTTFTSFGILKCFEDQHRPGFFLVGVFLFFLFLLLHEKATDCLSPHAHSWASFSTPHTILSSDHRLSQQLRITLSSLKKLTLSTPYENLINTPHLHQCTYNWHCVGGIGLQMCTTNLGMMLGPESVTPLNNFSTL